MPCPHNEITIVQRSQRQSAVAAAAYQSGEKLFCEYDQQVKHYPEKRGIVHNEILLPPNAPQEYADRNTLWNAAEAVEKQWNSQLARRWAMIVSILYNATPDEVKLLMIDPKQVEFTVYNGIAHLAVPVVSDPRKASGALTWAVNEMENRYKILSEKNVRDIRGYNKLAERDKSLRPMHQIVIFIDELADLMMVAPNEVEDAICRLAQKARAAGMHLVIATQRPSVDVITGIIKANIPSRIALSVSSSVDSRTILDMSGAEKLIGNGDMLFSPIGANKPTRIQGCFISDEEVEDVADFIKHNAEAEYDEGIMDEINRQAAIAGSTKKNSAAGGDDGEEPGDEMFPNAVEVVLDAKMASTTLLQRKLKLGYARAARLMDELESKGIIGPFEGSKPRQVLITKQQWMEKCALSDAPADDET